jgi:polyhydroxyalkanoate synthase
MPTAAAATPYALLDEARRRAGRALDRAGLGPVQAPSRVLAAWPGAAAARLRAYQPPPGDGAGAAPVLLILPAPIKRAYVWDLQPGASVVRHALGRGFRVFLLEWLDPGPAEDGGLGLAEFTWRLPLAALDAIAAETGEGAAILAGHSLGGTFAAILAALEPARVRGLALVDAPLAFGPGRGGPLARAVAAAPHARVLRALAGGGPVPGSFTALLSTAALPEAFVLQRWADLGASLGSGDAGASALHARVERWVLDELAMPGRLFEEVLELLYREDRLARGTLEVAGRRAGLDMLRSPVLAVVNPPGRVVPPASVLEGLAALPPDLPRRVLWHEGIEPGPAMQHLAPLIGRAAHARLWPRILDWAAATPGPVDGRRGGAGAGRVDAPPRGARAGAADPSRRRSGRGGGPWRTERTGRRGTGSPSCSRGAWRSGPTTPAPTPRCGRRAARNPNGWSAPRSARSWPPSSPATRRTAGSRGCAGSGRRWRRRRSRTPPPGSAGPGWTHAGGGPRAGRTRSRRACSAGPACSGRGSWPGWRPRTTPRDRASTTSRRCTTGCRR